MFENISRNLHGSGINDLICMRKNNIFGKIRAFEGDYVRIIGPRTRKLRVNSVEVVHMNSSLGKFRDPEADIIREYLEKYSHTRDK